MRNGLPPYVRNVDEDDTPDRHVTAPVEQGRPRPGRRRKSASSLRFRDGAGRTVIAHSSQSARRRRRRPRRRPRHSRRLAFLLLLLIVALTVGALRGGHEESSRASRPGGTLVVARAALRIPAGPAAAPLPLRTARFRLPAPVERTVAAAWQGRILIAGGLDTADQSTTGVFVLHSRAGTLHSLGALPQPVHDAAGAVIGGVLYVFGGGVTTSSDAVQAFDPISRRSWIAARLPRPLFDLAAAPLNACHLSGRRLRRAHATARDPRHPRRSPLHARRPAAHRAPLPGGRRRPGQARGRRRPDRERPLRRRLRLRPCTRARRIACRRPAPVAHAAAVVRGHMLYLLGGIDAAGAPTGAITAVNLSTHTVRRLARTIAPRADAASAQLGETTLLIGGRNTHTLATVLEIGDAG